MSEDLLMTPEQVKASIEELRARRSAIPAMRDYKPQGKGRKAAEPERDPLEVFGDLFKPAPSEDNPA